MSPEHSKKAPGPTPSGPKAAEAPLVQRSKSPAVAAILSFVWCGAGQLYNREVVKGTILIIAYFVALVVALAGVTPYVLPILWIGGIVDAYRGARIRRAPPAQDGHHLGVRVNRAAPGVAHSASADPVAALMPHVSPTRHRYFRKMLVIGVTCFGVLTLAAATTGSAIAVILVLAVGSFLVPTIYVEYIDEVDLFAGVPRSTLLKVALLTAAVAIPSAFALEQVVIGGASGLIPAVLIGLIEETVKLLVVLWVVRHSPFHFVMNGVIIGAAAGMGFAGFEDAAYAVAQLTQHGVSGLLSVLWLRQVLGPFGHGTWTALVCAALWKEHFGGRSLLDRRVIVAFLTAVLLHAAWDWSVVPGVLQLVWMLLVGAASIFLLRRQVQFAVAEERALTPAPADTAVLVAPALAPDRS